MAQQLSTSDLLELILDELTVVNEHIKDDDKKDKTDGKDIAIKVEGNEEVIALLTGMAALDPGKGKNIEDVAENIEHLCNAMKMMSNIDIKASKESVVTVTQLLTALGNLKLDDKYADNIKAASKSFGQLGTKLRDLIESLNDLQIDRAQVDGLHQIFSILRCIDNLSEKSGGIVKLSEIFSPIAALKIRFFFKQLSKAHKGEEIAHTIFALVSIMDAVARINKDSKNIKATVKLFKQLEKLDPKNAEKFGDYMAKFISPFKDIDKDKLEGVMGIIKTLNTSLMYVVGAIAILTVLAMIDMKAMGAATIAVVGILWSLTRFMKKISKMGKDIAAGGKTVSELGKGILMVSAAIGIITLLLMITDIGTITTGTTIVLGVLWSMVEMQKKIAKEQKGIKKGKVAVAQLGDALWKVVAAIGIMALLLKIFDIGTILMGTGLVLGVVFALTYMTKMLASGHDEKDATKAASSMAGICKALLWVSAAITIMTILVMIDLKSTIVGTVIVLAIIGMMVLMVKALASVEEKQLNAGKNTLMVLTACLVAVSLIALFTFIPLAQNIKDVLLGGLVVVGVLAIMIGMVWWMTKMDTDQVMQAAYALGILTICLIAVSLIARFILPAIGENWEDTAIGGALVVGVVLVMVAMVHWMSKIEPDNLKWALIAMGVMTIIVLAVALIVRHFFVPIGELWDDALIGAGVILGTIGFMTYIIKTICKEDKKQLMYAVGVLAAMALILWGISAIVEKYFIPIGDRWEAALPGALLILGTVYIMARIVKEVTKWVSDPQMGYKNLLIAEGIIVGIGVVLFALGKLMPTYADLAIYVGENWDTFSIGSVLICLLIAGWAKIIYEIGKHSEKKSFKKYMKTGAVVVTGIGAVLWAIAQVLPTYADLAIFVGKNWDTFSIGSTLIAALITGWAGIIYTIGKLSDDKKFKKYMATGAAVVLGIGGVLWAIGQLLPSYVETANLVYDNAEALAIGTLEIIGLITAWGLFIGAIGFIVDKLGESNIERYLLIGGAIVSGISLVLGLIGEMLPGYLETAIMMAQNAEDIAKGSLELAALITAWGVFFGLVGALCTNPAVLLAVGTGMAVLSGIAGVIMLISKAISEYMDMIMKVAKVSNIGKESDKTASAAESIMDIIITIGKRALNPLNAAAIWKADGALDDIKDAIVSLKTALLAYFKMIDELKKYSINDFKKFKNFVVGKNHSFVDTVEEIIERLDDLGIFATLKASVISQAIRPIFWTIKDFMDVVKSFAEMKYPTEFDENGKATKYAPMTHTYFSKAANAISGSFCFFLEKLGKAMEAWDPLKLIILDYLKDSIGPVMASLSDFVDAILKLTAGTIPTEFNEEGKAIKFRNVTAMDFQMAAIAVAAGFTTFLQFLGPALEELGPWAAIVIRLLGDGIEPVMNSVGTFASMIMDVLTGRDYTVPDPNDPEKTIQKHITFEPLMFTMAADTIVKAFTTFLNTLYNGLKDYNYKGILGIGGGNKVADLIESLNGISTVLDSVGQLCDLIMKNAENVAKYDFKDIANTMTDALTNMIDKLANKYAVDDMDDKLSDLCSNIEQVKKVTKKFSEIMDILHKLHTKVGGTYREYGDMYKSMIDVVIEPSVMLSYANAAIAIQNSILPLLEQYAKIMKFFEKLELKTNNINVSMSMKKIKKNAKALAEILERFVKGIEAYKSASSEVDFGVFSMLIATIDETYTKINESFEKYRSDYEIITTKLAKVVKEKFIPVTKAITNGLYAIYRAADKLDKLIINRAKKRNEELKKLKTHIEDISRATENLAEALKSVAANSNALADAQSQLNAARQNNQQAAQENGEAQPNKENTSPKSPAAAAQNAKSKLDAQLSKLDPAIAQAIKYAATAIAESVAQTFINTFNNREITINSNGTSVLNGKMRL